MKHKNSNVPARSSWAGGWATLRDLEILQTVIETGGVTTAADILNISQPAVSRVINQIEKRSGRVLFWRESNKLLPTADALILYREIKRIAESFSKLNHFHYSDDENILTIGVPPTIAYGFLNRLAARFMRENPDVFIKLRIISTDHIISALTKGDIDVAVADAVAGGANEQISILPLRKIRYVCAIPKSDELAKSDEITFEQLNGVNLVALGPNNIGRMTFDRMLNKYGCTPNTIAEVADLQTALTFVDEGVGVALTVSFFPFEHRNNVVYRGFKPDVTSQLVVFMKQSPNNLLSQSFADFVRQNQPEADSFSTPIE